MPHPQLSESIRNIVTVLWEQKKLEIDIEIYAGDRNWWIEESFKMEATEAPLRGLK